MSTASDHTGSTARGARPQVDVASAIVAHWWANRWKIAKVIGIATLIFIAVLLLIPRKYKAQATVIVLPPRFLPEVRTQPLTVSTVRSLLESGEVLQRVITRLRAARELLTRKAGTAADASQMAAIANSSAQEIRLWVDDSELAEYLSNLSAGELVALVEFEPEDLEEMTVDDLAKLVVSEETVEKKTAADLTFSPLVRLYAISDSGNKAQLIANTWAVLFEKMYDSLTRQKTTQQYESIRKQQNVSQGDLEDIQTTIVQYKSRNNLELLQRLVDENSEDLRDFSQQLVVKEAALDRLRGRLIRLQTVVAAMESEGRWVGRAAVDGQTSADAALNESPGLTDYNLSATLALADDEDVAIGATELASRIRNETIRSAQRLTAAMRESNEFYKRQPIQLMEKSLEQLQADYLQAASRLRTGSVRLSTMRETLVKLDEQLSGTQQFLTLSTALPEEAIGAAVTSGRPGDLRSVASVQLQRQELNPAWQQLQQQRAELYQEFESLQAEIAELVGTVPEMKSELDALQNQLYQARLQEAFIQENLERWQNNNEELFRNYVELTNEISQTAQDITLLEQEVRSLQRSVQGSRERVETYQKQFDQASSDLQVLELRQRAIQRNADLLLQKVQEAQIAVQEDVSDVSVAARAVAPERHYFPQRTLFLLLACIVTAGVYLGLLARQRYMELQQA